MKKGWAFELSGIGVAIAIFAGRQYLRLGDPEVTNAADLIDGGSQDEAPDFFASDSALLIVKAHKIEEVIRADDNSTLANAPYLLLLEDGRFAFGYSDEDGKTRPIFVARDLPYQLYLYEEAWEQWEKHKPDGSGTITDASAR